MYLNEYCLTLILTCYERPDKHPNTCITIEKKPQGILKPGLVLTM